MPKPVTTRRRYTRTLRRLAGSVAVAAVLLTSCTLTAGESTGQPAEADTPTETPAAGVDRRPNFVLISTDDQRADDLRWMPHTRRLLADRGVKLTSGLAPHPQCCPARAMLLSGAYGHNNGVHGNYGPHGGFHAMDPDHTIATWLDDAGYQTAMIGKFLNGWHGRDGSQPGWDVFNPLSHGIYSSYDFTLYRDGDRYSPTGVHSADAVGADAVSTIRSFARQDAPFFVWASQVAPHNGDGNPWPTPARRHADVLSGPRSPSFTAPTFNRPGKRKPSWLTRVDRPLNRVRLQRMFTQRIRSLQAVDENNRRIVAELRRTGELDNTYLVFVSDNGFLLGEHRLTGKNVPYEEALRIPFLVRGPGIPAGSRTDEAAGLLDIAPTFLAAARARADQPVDGVNLLPTLRHGKSLPRHALLLQGGSGSANRDQKGWLFRSVRTARYTFSTWPGTGDVELYDRRVDPYQRHNAVGSAEYRHVESRLRSRLRDLRDCAGQTCTTLPRRR